MEVVSTAGLTGPFQRSTMKEDRNIVGSSGPTTLNLQAIDVCNSRCVMCNIWKDGRRETISLEELGTYLRQPYFSSIAHVGVTGGEPTLRKDLIELYRLLPECLPRLEGASFMTHGMQTDRTVAIYSQVHEMYRTGGLEFHGMVSLDGIGDVHDSVRGRRGAFDAASRTLLTLKDRGVNVIAACTVVRSNVYGLHDLLDWGQKNGVYVRFRIAEFIRPLYNADCSSEIRSFDDREVRHLVCFFSLLITEYEKDEAIRRTYRSIQSILTGGKRLVACPYQRGAAVNMGARGELAACAPKGSSFVPDFSGDAVEKRVREDRKQIAAEHCATCIHDYHDEWSESSRVELVMAEECGSALYGMEESSIEMTEVPVVPLDWPSIREILLVGWYGTETAGDIAILRGIIAEYSRENSALRFCVLSLHPNYTRTTIAEWPPEIRARVRIADYVSRDAMRAVQDCDAVVMAGGPLMDIHETGKILRLFVHFARAGKPRVIEGCGVGPLNNEEYRWNVCRIARLATQIRVRDEASRDLLRRFGIRKSIEVRPDPAHTFIEEQGIRHHGGEGKVIRCFLRELTCEYPQSLTPARATANLTSFLERLLDWYPEHRIELWAMHHFPVGKDDRIYARDLVRSIRNPRLTFVWEPRTPREILDAMAAAEFCVCMRFHSCVFASAVGSPFIAIDYTDGGKIAGFLDDSGQLGRVCTLAGLEHLDRAGFETKLRTAKNVQTGLFQQPSDRPKVLHIVQRLGGGGAARAMVSVATHSRRSGGPEHTVVSLQPAERTGIELVRDANLALIDSPPPRDLKRAMAAADIVLVHWWNYPEIVRLFASELPAMRLMAWIHVGGYHAPYVLSRKLVEFVDFAAGCSEHTCRHPAMRNCGTAAENSRSGLIFASADFERLRGFRARSHEGFRVGYVGTPDPTKMHPHFVRMSSMVEVPGVRFVICGGGSTEWLETEAKERGCADKFELLGAVDDVSSVLETIDVYGYPLCAETYAAAELNIQEVMFSGIAIVAFPHGGISDLILHNQTGLLVNTEEEYARAIEFLYSHPRERERLGNNAAQYARAHWGADKMGVEFNRRFERLLKQPKLARRWTVNSELLVRGELPRQLAMHPGARLFVESLEAAGSPYCRSVLGETDEEILSAEEEIVNQSLLFHYSCAFGYARVLPKDRYLELWSGLGHMGRGHHSAALEAFERCSDAGLRHWRVSWYRAKAAKALGRVEMAAAEIAKVLRAVPAFEPAQLLQAELPMPKVLPAQAEAALRHSQEAQRWIRAGQFERARNHLECAAKILPGEVLILELMADMDCRLGRFESARVILAAIRKREPKRATPRLAVIGAILARQETASPQDARATAGTLVE